MTWTSWRMVVTLSLNSWRQLILMFFTFFRGRLITIAAESIVNPRNSIFCTAFDCGRGNGAVVHISTVDYVRCSQLTLVPQPTKRSRRSCHPLTACHWESSTRVHTHRHRRLKNTTKLFLSTEAENSDYFHLLSVRTVQLID